jgi:beta-lactam-binding protein with PASTA domain
MYYNGSRVFFISFLVSLFTSVIVCAGFFFLLPTLKPSTDVVVPDLLGSTTEQARVIAETRGLLFIVGGDEENENVPPNTVSRQTPLPGSVVREKTTITVFVSKGSSKFILPELKGLGLSEATVRLSELGLTVGEVKSEENAEIAKDKIISTVPRAGTHVKKGDAVTVILSRGLEVIEMPRLIGRSLSSAKRIIEDNGFVVGNISYEVSTEFNVGIIIRQSPSAGQKIEKGSKINLVVATVLE